MVLENEVLRTVGLSGPKEQEITGGANYIGEFLPQFSSKSFVFSGLSGKHNDYDIRLFFVLFCTGV
jgi:hypothetical protein